MLIHEFSSSIKIRTNSSSVGRCDQMTLFPKFPFRKFKNGPFRFNFRYLASDYRCLIVFKIVRQVSSVVPLLFWKFTKSRVKKNRRELCFLDLAQHKVRAAKGFLVPWGLKEAILGHERWKRFHNFSRSAILRLLTSQTIYIHWPFVAILFEDFAPRMYLNS